MRNYCISDFLENSSIEVEITTGTAHLINAAITSLIGEFELETCVVADDEVIENMLLIVAEETKGIIKVYLVSQDYGLTLKEAIKRPERDCTAEEYFRCDCRNCTKDCQHRDCIRRLPVGAGGMGACENLSR